jgi:superfamily I DNA/RNA helicase
MSNPDALNPQQRLAVETFNGPVLILAGAGTGKTRVITHRIAHLISKGVPPENILAVTFTNKAAREMRQRARKLIQDAARKGGSEPRLQAHDSQPMVCTFHSLCVRILRQHIHVLGYKRNFVIYDESDQIGAIKKILSGISTRGEKTDPTAVLSLLSRYKNGGERAMAFADENVRAMAEHIRSRYESALHACNAVDFDDLILLTLRLFSEHHDVLERCRAKYRFVMVDEYQDTNAAQFRLVHALTERHRNLCVVGDDDQSIYGWRGAEIGNLLNLEKYFPDVKIIKLEQNYRSTTTILQAANAIIKNNARRRAKQLWSQKGCGAKITLHTFGTDDEEARSVVEQIEFGRLARCVPWLDNAILFRTNQQSRPLETALRAAGVRYHLIGGQSFFDRREVRDLLAYFKLFLNPNDDVSLLRIANVPARGLSDVTMERLLGASHERKTSVFSAMKNPAVLAAFQVKARESIESFVELVQRTSARLRDPAATQAGLQLWATHFLDEIRYWEELRRGEKDVESAENRIRNLKDLIATLDQSINVVSGSLHDRLEAFLEEVTLDTDREEDEEPRGDAVTLITMHSCKGLEFAHVYIVGMEEGLLPHSRSKAEGTLDEERRLFYVAVTRAMQTLAISHCESRKKYGQLLPCHPSSFLKELPADLVEHASEKANEPVRIESGRKHFAAIRAAIG